MPICNVFKGVLILSGHHGSLAGCVIFFKKICF